MNVTDGVGPATNHGITRVERKLALEMAARADVEFVVIDRGRVRAADRVAVAARLDRPRTDDVPYVERFGIDRPPVDPQSRNAALQRRLRSARTDDRVVPLVLRRVDLGADDVLVSVGVDWSRPLMDEAERLVFGAGGRYIGFCYDTIPIDHPEWLFPSDPIGFRRHLERMARIASSIVCISEHTRSDLAHHIPGYPADRLEVITLGADAAVDVGSAHAAFAAAMFDGEPYAVYCATLDRRKNHQVLYRALRELGRRGRRVNLVFVGMLGSGVDDLVNSMRHDPTVAGRIAHVTNCDDQHLAALYELARFAVYPSFYEGWGLGVTEAMAHGKRCIVASGSSLGEASFGMAPVIHPLDTTGWAQAMAEHFDQPADLGDVELPTWERATTELLQIAAR